MNCPHCGYLVSDQTRFCPKCGRELPANRQAPMQYGGQVRAAQTTKKAAGAGLMLGAAARAARLEAVYDPDAVIGKRAYNAVIMGVLLWGILVNYLLCYYVGSVYQYISPVAFMILYVIVAIAGIIIAGKSNKPLISFLGYNMVVVPFGLVISTAVEEYGGMSSSIVTYAFLYTLMITLGMTVAALAFPKFFEKIGGALTGVLIGVILCEIILMFLGIRQSAVDWIVAGLFSLYIGFDVYRSQQFTPTVDNAVDCALDIYLDIAYVFIRLLSILAKKDD